MLADTRFADSRLSQHAGIRVDRRHDSHDEPISSALERADRLMYRARDAQNTVVMEHENEQAEEEVPKQKVLIVDDAEIEPRNPDRNTGQ